MNSIQNTDTKFSMVTNCLWRYPIIVLVLILAVVVLGFTAGSPFWPRATIKNVSTSEPGGTIWAVAQELDGSSSSYTNVQEYGMAYPAQTLVIDPLKSRESDMTNTQKEALAQYVAAKPDEQRAWATNYDNAIKKTLGMSDTGVGGMSGMTPVPMASMIGELKGDFGPVPVLAKSILQLAESGYLETYFQGISPYQVYHYTNIWLYDQPYMLNTAIKNGLTDDQWGMIKERGFFVGPWYLILPAIAHVELPGGSTGQGFLLWNILLGIILIVLFPLVPGLRDLPKKVKLYKLVYAADPNDSESRNARGHSYSPRPDAFWLTGRSQKSE